MDHRKFQINHLSSLVTIIEVLLYEKIPFGVNYKDKVSYLIIKDAISDLVQKRLDGEIKDGYIKEISIAD